MTTNHNLTAAALPWALTATEYRLCLISKLLRERKYLALTIVAMMVKDAARKAGGCKG